MPEQNQPSSKSSDNNNQQQIPETQETQNDSQINNEDQPTIAQPNEEQNPDKKTRFFQTFLDKGWPGKLLLLSTLILIFVEFVLVIITIIWICLVSSSIWIHAIGASILITLVFLLILLLLSITMLILNMLIQKGLFLILFYYSSVISLFLCFITLGLSNNESESRYINDLEDYLLRNPTLSYVSSFLEIHSTSYSLKSYVHNHTSEYYFLMALFSAFFVVLMIIRSICEFYLFYQNNPNFLNQPYAFSTYLHKNHTGFQPRKEEEESNHEGEKSNHEGEKLNHEEEKPNKKEEEPNKKEEEPNKKEEEPNKKEEKSKSKKEDPKTIVMNTNDTNDTNLNGDYNEEEVIYIEEEDEEEINDKT